MLFVCSGSSFFTKDTQYNVGAWSEIKEAVELVIVKAAARIFFKCHVYVRYEKQLEFPIPAEFLDLFGNGLRSFCVFDLLL